jgi:hypothetical protein
LEKENTGDVTSPNLLQPDTDTLLSSIDTFTLISLKCTQKMLTSASEKPRTLESSIIEKAAGTADIMLHVCV